MRKIFLRKLIFVALFASLGTVFSTYYIPVGAAKLFPIQHMINVVAGVFLGPMFALLAAFLTSLLRVLMGAGSVLAFPGSMIGAFLAGFFFKRTGKIYMAACAEVIGTGGLGAMISSGIATLVMSREAALFSFVPPFFLSSLLGAVIGAWLAGRLAAPVHTMMVFEVKKEEKESRRNDA